MEIIKSLFYFFLAGLCEIGGGYLVWLWIREGKSAWYALAGSAILVLYGVIPTLQPANFGRVYAAYGGIFIVFSPVLRWEIGKRLPDRYDNFCGVMALAG